MKGIETTRSSTGGAIAISLPSPDGYNAMQAALSAMAGYAPRNLSWRGNVQVWDRSTPGGPAKLEIIGEEWIVGRLLGVAKRAAEREVRRRRAMAVLAKGS